MELLDVSLMAVSERLDSEDGQDHIEFVWISFSVHLYICWTAVFDCCQFIYLYVYSNVCSVFAVRDLFPRSHFYPTHCMSHEQRVAVTWYLTVTCYLRQGRNQPLDSNNPWHAMLDCGNIYFLI